MTPLTDPTPPKVDQDPDTTSARLPVALTIAGSDSGGGAGIQADLKTFHKMGVFGTSAVTAITAQNTLGVHAVHPVPPEVVTAQIRAVASDLAPSATKAGMLGTSEIILAVADTLASLTLRPFVLDPVMVATSGDRLLEGTAEKTLRDHLLPLADLVTPNVPEAEILAGLRIETEADLARVARVLVELGAGAALVKGGHLAGPEVVDVFWDGVEQRTWRRPRLSTRHTHGTGCTLSAAITARLASGVTLIQSVHEGIEFVAEAIRSAPGLGKGRGPLNHWAETIGDS